MVLPLFLDFQWDGGNSNKNLDRHGISNEVAEEVFYDNDKQEFSDDLHSEKEPRYRIVGKTVSGRLLLIVFTLRDSKIRIISARDVNRKEVCLYEKTA